MYRAQRTYFVYAPYAEKRYIDAGSDTKANFIAGLVDNSVRFLFQRLYFGASRVSKVLQKCCNQKNTQWTYWTQWTFKPLKNAKIQTKTHEMDVLDTMDTLETEQSKVL
jgi:hypothetical protein